MITIQCYRRARPQYSIPEIENASISLYSVFIERWQTGRGSPSQYPHPQWQIHKEKVVLMVKFI